MNDIENQNDELTLKDIFFLYVVNFFKWLSKSVIKTFTSLRLIVVVLAIAAVPLLQYFVFFKAENSNNNLYANSSAYNISLKEEYIELIFPAGISGEPSSRSGYAKKLAEEIVNIKLKTLVKDSVLEALVDSPEFKSRQFELYSSGGKINSNFVNTLGFKNSDVESKAFLKTVVVNYIVLTSLTGGNFQVSVVSNPYKYYSDIENQIPEQKALAAKYQSYPAISKEFTEIISSFMDQTALNSTADLFEEYFYIGTDGTTVLSNPVNKISNIVKVYGPKMDITINRVHTEATETDFIVWALTGLLFGLLFFVAVDAFKAINKADREYREKRAK